MIVPVVGVVAVAGVGVGGVVVAVCCVQHRAIFCSCQYAPDKKNPAARLEFVEST